MIPLTVLLATFVILSLLTRLQIPGLTDVPTAWRWALAVMFLLTASAHWGSRRADLVRMVPAWVPDAELAVTLTGIAEIAGAIGLVIPALAPYAATGLVLLLIAMFPANVRAAIEGLSIGGRAATPLIPRIWMQLFFIAALGFAASSKSQTV